MVNPVQEDIALSQKAVANGGAQLLVEGIVWCPLSISDASYFEEVCSLVGQVLFLFNEGKDPFEAGGPLINLILFRIVAEHGDQAQELCQLSVTAF